MEVGRFVGSVRRLAETRPLIREQPRYFALYWLSRWENRPLRVQQKAASNQNGRRKSECGAAGGVASQL